MVECLVPSDRKPGGVLVVAKGTLRTFSSMWVGRAKESDEHPVVNQIGHVARVRSVGQCVENENGGPEIVKLTAAPSYLRPDGDDVGVQKRWTPEEGCKACDSAHGNKHAVRCEARRHEYRLKCGRNTPVMTRRASHEPDRASHEPDRAPEGPVPSEPNPVSDCEMEQVLSSQSTATAGAPTVTAQTSHAHVKRIRTTWRVTKIQRHFPVPVSP